MSDNDNRRGQTVPVPEWWLAEARKLTKGKTQPELSKLIEAVSGRALSQSGVSRLLAGKVTPLFALDALSDALRIPRPVVIFSSRIEAQQYSADTHSGELKRADSELESIDPKPRKRQR